VVTGSLTSEAKTMKTKTWTVITNTGKQADLESGLEKKVRELAVHCRDHPHEFLRFIGD
jgi:hypothetical protein